MADTYYDPYLSDTPEPPRPPEPPKPDPGILDAVINSFKALKEGSQSGGRLTIDPTKLLDLPGGIVEGIQRTGKSWNKALELLSQGYEPSDPEVLKHAFDIALNMLPGGIAIKEGARVLQTPGAKIEPKPAVAPAAQDLTGQSSKMGSKPASTAPTKQELFAEIDQLYKDGLITAKEVSKKKDMVEIKFDFDNALRDDLGAPTSRTEYFPETGHMVQQYEKGAASFDRNGNPETYKTGGSPEYAFDTIKADIVDHINKNTPAQTPYFTPTVYKDPADPKGAWKVEYKGQTINFNTEQGAINHMKLVEKTEGVKGKVVGGSGVGGEGQAFEPKYKVKVEKGQFPHEDKVTWYRPNKDAPGGVEEITQFVDKTDKNFMSFAENQTAQASLHDAFQKSHQMLKDAADSFKNMPTFQQMHEEALKKIEADRLAKEAMKDQVVKEVKDYFDSVPRSSPEWENKWYQKIDVASSHGQLRERQAFGSWASQYASHEPDLVRAAIQADKEGIGKVVYHNPESDHVWIVNLKSKDMTKEPMTALEKRFPDGTRIDTLPAEPDVAHPGPIFAYHGTGSKFQPKETPRGKMEMEFAEKEKSSDIGWHFGTVEQASNRVLAKSGEGKVIPAYIDVKTPFTMSDMGGWNPRSMVQDMRGQLEDMLNDPATSLLKQSMLKRRIESLKEVQDKVIDLDKHYTSTSTKDSYDLIRGWLDKYGYDSIRYLNQAEGEGWSYIVWNRGKVKSAPTPDHTLYVAPGFPRVSARDQEQAQD